MTISRRKTTQRPERWRFNPTSPLAQGLVFAGLGRIANSTHYRDSSLYGNHGTLVGGPTWAWSQQLGRWYTSYDGGNDVCTSTYAPLNGATEMTATFWVLQATSGGSDYGLWVGTKDHYNEVTGFFIGRNAANHWQYYIGDASQAADIACSDGLWQHIAIRYKSGVLRDAYYNGISAGAASVVTSTMGNLQLELGWNTTSNLAAKCYLADAMLWNRALSPAEIALLADPSNVMLSGLLLPPKRRVFAAVTAAPATGNPWHYYANA